MRSSNITLRIPDYKERKSMHDDQMHVDTYKSSGRGNPEPTNVATVEDSNFFQLNMRHSLFAHAMLHDKAVNATSAKTQLIGSFSGFQYSLRERTVKSRTYYHVIFLRPPNKSTVNEAMERCRSAANFKRMPFIQLVGDQPVYALMVELKSENKDRFCSVLPVLGSFHIQMAFMNTIYKRFADSGLSHVVVAAGLVQAGSVESALKGRHYKRCMRIHKLLYECLARRMITGIAREDDSSVRAAYNLTCANSQSERRSIFDALVDSESFHMMVDTAVRKIESSSSSHARIGLAT